MVVDDITVKELLDLFDNVFEIESEVRDIVSGAKVRIKEAKTSLKDWSERNEITKRVINRLYKDYSQWRETGKDGEEQDNQYVELLIALQDKYKEEQK